VGSSAADLHHADSYQSSVGPQLPEALPYNQRAVQDVACSLLAAAFTTYAKSVLVKDVLRHYTRWNVRAFGLVGVLLTWVVWAAQAAGFLLVPAGAAARRDSTWPAVASVGTSAALLLETVMGLPRLWAPRFTLFMVAASCGLVDVRPGPLLAWLPVLFLTCFGVHAWDTRTTTSVLQLAQEATVSNIMPMVAYIVVREMSRLLRRSAVHCAGVLCSTTVHGSRDGGNTNTQRVQQWSVGAAVGVDMVIGGLLLAFPQHMLLGTQDLLAALAALQEVVMGALLSMAERLGITSRMQAVSDALEHTYCQRHCVVQQVLSRAGTRTISAHSLHSVP
jgi:hypothetical protein